MSTLRTFNLQNPDSGTVNIEMDQGGNTLMTGITTVRGAAHFTSTSGSDAVGIGTDITAYKLDVRVTGAEAGLRVYNPDTSSNASGIIRLGNDDNQNSAFLKLNGANNSSTVGGAANLVLGTGTAREVHLATSGTSRLNITSAGLVGVNCTPLSQFQVKTGTNQNIALSSMSSEAAIEAYNDAGSANVPLRLRASVHKFFIGSTEGLRVHTNGLIGVGYDSPTAYGRMTVAMPSQSGGAAIQVANSSNGSGDGTTSNVVLRSVNNSASQWADAEYRASQHIFAIQGTERMRINANGYVTKPNQPRFFARLSATYTGYNGQNTGSTWIAFDVLDYNVGGGFQTSGSDQGLFVAPVSGLYLFHAAAYKNTGTADWSQSWFNINSSRANGTDFVHSSGTRFAQNAIQVYMTAGQKIGFHPYNNQINNEIITTGNHTWFKGCLLG